MKQSIQANTSKVLLTLATALSLAGSGALAQTIRINYRPLTPQDIKNFGLTNTTQKSCGAPNVGIGQPVYLEALASTQTVVTGVGFTNRFTTAITAVNWSVISAPPGSTATIVQGPLSNAVPSYDGGDRIGYIVVGRAMLKPDVPSYYNFDISAVQGYKILTQVCATNGIQYFTNAAYGAKFMGHKNYLCVLCHADKQTNFDATAHATAFSGAIQGVDTNHFSANCISCHTLGYDTTAGATNDGFDDIAASVGWTFPGTASPTNWSGMPSNLQSRANVQCENCHGPASTHMSSLGQTNLVDVSLSAGTCGQCHDSLTHHVKVYEWGQSLHSTGYVFRFSGACQPCHSAKGFIETWDPYYLATNKVPRSTEQEGISCSACHDPHTPGMGEHQLRAITTATLSNGVVITEAQAGDGVLCINCHHSRQKATEIVASTNSISPHHGTQGDLLAGENGYEYGLKMPRSRHMAAVENSCVGCHMQLIALTSYSNLNTKVGGHTFKVAYDDGTNTHEVTEVCSICHVEQDTFDFGGEDYDRDGTVEGIQTEVQGLLDQIALLLPPAGTGVTYAASYTPSQRKAYWNYMFIWEDKSLGVHNPKYATALLQASLDDLLGGIDIDRDDLIDTWEMAKFGNLTSQTGNDDADGDGVKNSLEQQLGTNPGSSDTDGDGISDLAEIQYGSNPLDPASMAMTNTVGMLPAVEVAYMPGVAGQTQVFQSISAMGNAGWTNAGGAFVSSNSWSYQLISLRDSTQKYFRVIKP